MSKSIQRTIGDEAQRARERHWRNCVYPFTSYKPRLWDPELLDAYYECEHGHLPHDRAILCDCWGDRQMKRRIEVSDEERDGRLAKLVDEYGCADSCEIEGTGRYALMEADEGPADNGGPWWTVGDDWQRLLDESANQEHPHEWPAARLFDLDTGDDFEIEQRIKYVASGLQS